MNTLHLALVLPLAAITLPAQAVWTQLAPTTPPSARNATACAADLTGMLVFGGNTGAGKTDELWRFDPFTGTDGTWTNLAPVGPGPSPRSDSGAAYDLARGVLVIFGGRTASGNTGLSLETWEWDAATNAWTDKTPTVPVVGTNTPPELEQVPMVYEVAFGRCLLFGGRGNTTTAPMEYDGTWSWDGTAWTPLTPTTAPAARRSHCLALNQATGTVLMWGGIASGATLGDTWRWDGADWTSVPTATTPFANALHNGTVLNRMVFDDARGRFVLTAGVYPGGTTYPPDDTYEFDGSDWVNRGSSGIGNRYSAAVAYVPAAVKTYFFGGYKGTRQNDTWEYQTDAFASFVTQSGGCAGGGQVPTLQARALPWVGDTMVIEANNTTANSLDLLALALLPGPIALAPFGYPGCTAEFNPIGNLLMLPSPATGKPTADLSFPAAPVLKGLVVYTQLASIEPGFLLAMSGRGDATLGLR